MLSLRTVLGDERGFIHKRGSFLRKLGKKVLGGVPVVGGIATGIGEAVGVFQGPGTISTTSVVPGGFKGCPPGFVSIAGRCIPTSVPSVISAPGSVFAPVGGGGPTSGPCPPTYRFEPLGISGSQGRPCVKANMPSLAATGPVPGQFDGFGEAQMGRFGAGLQPSVRESSTRVCPRGAVLAVDGLCYNRRDISNKERAWPRGRRPLLTGGEMRCISVASSAAKKLQRKQKQLEQLGLLKRPSRARRALPAGHVAQVKHG